MTDPESILQLGIEAARDGNKEEARNLFRLLTREDPANVQAWIWLAGVAENREERRSSLEQVLQLDPDNQLAQKGLQALNDQPADEVPAAAPSEPPPSREPEPSPPRDERDMDMDMDSDPFAELDSLSAVFQEDPGAVRRDEPEPTRQPEHATDEPPRRDGEPHSERATRSSQRSSATPARQRSSRSSAETKEKETMSSSSSSSIPRVALLAVVALVLLLALGFLFRDRLPFIGSRSQPAAEQPAPPPEGEQPPPEGEQPAPPPPEGEQPGAAGQPTTTPLPGQPPGEEAPAEQPPAGQPEPTPPPEGGDQPAPPPPPEGDVAAANPAIVPPGTPLEAAGWVYDYPGWPPGPVQNIGDYSGNYIIVITNVINNSGQEQPIPPDFFVLKDGQGRIYNPLPEVSAAFITTTGGADMSMQDAVPADGITRSMPVIFDVAPDAGSLVYFSRQNTGQGWQIR